MKTKNNKQERGITLIALVITIIVLLILAGVAISMLSGENAILNRAAEAKKEYENSEKNEISALEYTEYIMSKSEPDTSEVSIGGNNTTMKNAIVEALSNTANEISFNNDINSAKADANEKGYLIKLNKTVYVDETIVKTSGDELYENQNIVIDLNGQELVYMEKGNSYLFNGNEVKGIYIIDSSEDKSGKIRMATLNDYNYDEKYDTNRDGVICYEDMIFWQNGKGKNNTSADWETYKYCDLNGDGKVDGTDGGLMSYYKKQKHYENSVTGNNIYLDIGENAIITACGHNK